MSGKHTIFILKHTETYYTADLLDLFDKETEIYTTNYLEYFVQRLQKSNNLL